VSSFSQRLLKNNLQPRNIQEVFTIAQCLKYVSVFPDLGMSYRGQVGLKEFLGSTSAHLSTSKTVSGTPEG
jgi:hypothetical protein